MHAGAVVLLLVAALGLAAFLSMGIFFAVRPRIVEKKTLLWPYDPSHSPIIKGSSLKPSPIFRTTTMAVDSAGTSMVTHGRQNAAPSSAPAVYTRPSVQERPTTAVGDAEEVLFDEQGQLEAAYGKAMPHYGRIIGLAFRDGLLYVPSHRNGNISVLTVPELSQLEEISCRGCSIYDMAVLSSGDLVVAQGKRKLLTKISRSDGRVLAQVKLRYATKGVALGADDVVYVLARSHDTIHRYDGNLNVLGETVFANEANDDCNFLDTDASGLLYVSCEGGVTVVDEAGALVRRLRPLAQTAPSYGLGVAVDDGGHALVVRRGSASADDYGADGQLRRTLLAHDAYALWSDLVVSGSHAFVVDYIHVGIKAFKYR